MGKKTFAYVSIWSHGERASGLSLYDFDPERGTLTKIRQLDDKTGFAVSAVDPRRGILYILDESDRLPELRVGGGGRLFAFHIDPESGGLEQLSCVPTFCPNPSYVTLDSTGHYLVVSNHAGRACVNKLVRDAYGKFSLRLEFDDSAVELFSVKEDGSVGELLDAAIHEGSGPDPRFQTNPHPHCAVMSPCGRFFAVCDKGNDGVYLYRIDRERDRLVLSGPPYACAPGSRPRFCAYHPSAPYLYHNNEGRTQVDAYRCDAHGRLERIGSFGIQTAETAALPGKWEQQDFRIDSRGRFLYTLVSDPSMVAVFRVDGTSGELELVQNLLLHEQMARGCALSPDGRFLTVACAGSGKLVTLAVGEDGRLTDSAVHLDEPCAAFITFYQP